MNGFSFLYLTEATVLDQWLPTGTKFLHTTAAEKKQQNNTPKSSTHHNLS